MKVKALRVAGRGLAVLVSAGCLGGLGLALAGDEPSLPEHLGGLLNDYTPASVSGGPYEMAGKWSLEVNPWSGTASFSAAMNMETSDYGISNGNVNPDDATSRGAHTHHIALTGTASTNASDLSGCPTFKTNPPTARFVVTGTVSVTGNGAPAPFQVPPKPLSTLQICVLGGSTVEYSNITITFIGLATGHFGPQAIHGVVTCGRSFAHAWGNCDPVP
jgi:hypothetical protein